MDNLITLTIICCSLWLLLVLTCGAILAYWDDVFDIDKPYGNTYKRVVFNKEWK